ncbi:unnamed protein product, partial [Polarella glacialis]
PILAVAAFVVPTLLFPTAVLGHSYLALPASRNLLRYEAGAEKCPHCLNSGGPDNVKSRGGGVWPSRLAPGSHGLCGDPAQGKPNPDSLAGEVHLLPGPISATYRPGDIAEFHVSVSAHHKGHYEFRVCNRALDGRSLLDAAEGQACLDSWLLERAPPAADCIPDDSRGDCQPIDPRHPERWYLPPPRPGTLVAGPNFTDDQAVEYPVGTEVHVMQFKIPEGLSCSHCTLQWYAATNNNCVYDGDYLPYFCTLQSLGWDTEQWAPHSLADWATCEKRCCGPTGSGAYGEESWNCADIAVLAGDGSTAQTTAPPVIPVPTTTAGTAETTTTTATGRQGACVAAWGKCGGMGWDGPTCCVGGYTCVVDNRWYSQCVP